MNTTASFRNDAWNSFNSGLVMLVLALAMPARAETQPAPIPFSDLGARATADYQGDALGITPTADGARLRCGFQKLEGHATPEGLWLESTGPGGGKLRLLATKVSRETGFDLNLQPSTSVSPIGTVSVQDKLVRFTRPGLTEEYSVSVDGVRQDFVIESPPLNPQRSTLNRPAGDLRVELALSGARAEPAAGGVKLTFEGSGRTLVYGHLRVEDATGRELTARLEVLSADRLAVSVADANATYPVRIDPTFTDAEWVTLGSGIGGSFPNGSGPSVAALAVSGTNLYTGGWFTTAGGAPANYIAKWSGTAWSALGSGIVGYYPGVYALAVSGTNLYVGGSFTNAGGVTVNNIAKWNGSAWSPLGSGISGPTGYGGAPVAALAVSGTNLYAGGSFGTAGGLPANYIAKWNGSAWSTLGPGMDRNVYALAVSGTNLYAGGRFGTAGGVSANCIAKWNGSSWSALGSGMGGGDTYGPYVDALAVSGGTLYAGGDFTTAGGVPANYIARWNGSTWSALGSGLNAFVEALAVSGTNLYAGGNLTNAGGVPVNCIAKWNGSAWSALGSGITDGPYPYVYALAADGAEHLFVGGDFTRAGTNLSFYIAEAILLPSVPTILMAPQTQTTEAGATVHLAVDAAGEPPPAYQWYFNGTNLLSCTTSNLVLTSILFSQSGTYTVVVSNLLGAVTSAPVTLNVIAPVARRLVPGINLIAQAGNFLGLDYRDNLGPTANWQTMATMTLSNSSQFYFDVSQPLPPQRFYRAWRSGTPGVIPSLSLPGMVTAITLTGSIGASVRLDYINQFGPIDAWVTLATVTLTNTSQLYFDTSSIGKPARLWRIVPVP